MNAVIRDRIILHHGLQANSCGKDATIAELKSDVSQLRHELAQLKKMNFGSKRERYIEEVNANQLSLFTTDEVESDIEQADIGQHIEDDRKAPKKHNGRNELPEHQPVQEVIIELEEDTTGMIRIG